MTEIVFISAIDSSCCMYSLAVCGGMKYEYVCSWEFTHGIICLHFGHPSSNDLPALRMTL